MSNESGAKVAFGCTTALVSVILGSILNGWVLSVLWAWFVMHQFHVAPIGVVQAMGIAMTARMFLPSSSTKTEEKSLSEALANLVGTTVLGPLMVLGTAWILKAFL